MIFESVSAPSISRVTLSIKPCCTAGSSGSFDLINSSQYRSRSLSLRRGNLIGRAGWSQSVSEQNRHLDDVLIPPIDHHAVALTAFRHKPHPLVQRDRIPLVLPHRQF